MKKQWIPILSAVVSLLHFLKYLRKNNFLRKLLNLLKNIQAASPHEIAINLYNAE